VHLEKESLSMEQSVKPLTAALSVIPILLLIGAGAIARRLDILRSGDERVLNSYLYYFALPALFIIDLAETSFGSSSLPFLLASAMPPLVTAGLLVAIAVPLGLSRDRLVLLIVSSVFGSLTFFGLPFVLFAIPSEQAEHLATVTAAIASPLGIGISTLALEGNASAVGADRSGYVPVAVRLLRNPLLLSVLLGGFLSFAEISLPEPIARSLHLLGVTTAPVALFMLGVFLYGRTYEDLPKASGLALLRILVLPLMALVAARLLGLTDMETVVVVVMHSSPTALSLIVLSERYNFHQPTLASLVLVSSLGAAVYLTFWMMLLSP
jgi:predicted permease